MTERDIPEAVECVQTAFAEDPYFQWLFDNTKVSPAAENNAQARTTPPWVHSMVQVQYTRYTC